MRPEDKSSHSSDLQCILCKKADETKITGPLSCKLNIAAHQNCLLYASGIYCKNSPTYDDLFGFDVKDVEDESKRGKKLRCPHCKRFGATAGCEVKSCKHTYHYPCASEAGAIPNEDESKGTYRLYCKKHNPHDNNVGLKERDAGATPSGSGLKISDRNEEDSSHGGSEPTRSSRPASPEPGCSVVSLSTKLHSPPFVLLFPLSDTDSLLVSRSQNKKRKYEEASDLGDETQGILDPVLGPIESETEDTPPRQNTQSLECDSRSRDNKEPRQEGAPTPNGGGDCGDDDCDDDDDDMVDESQSLLPEYLENVPFTVIADSGPSIGSVAENSLDPFSPAPSPADTALSNFDQPVSASEQAAALHSNITVPPNPPSPPFDNSSNAKKASHKDLPAKAECCASMDIPPTVMTDELPGSHVKRLNDKPLDLTAPAGCSNVQVSRPVSHVGVPDSGATLFWRRCNEVGCTEAIFTELTRQLSSLAERVQNQHATQQDYAVSLRMLKASGKLPAIFKQMEKDLEEQKRQLQKKREALDDAMAVLDENQLI